MQSSFVDNIYYIYHIPHSVCALLLINLAGRISLCGLLRRGYSSKQKNSVRNLTRVVRGISRCMKNQFLEFDW